MIGKIISHYKILEKLGEGGMGEVYRAEDINLKREVALKFLPTEYSRNPESKKRFINEAISASNLDHNNICVIHEISETENGQLFISMNFCRGKTLQNHIRENELTIKEIIKIITQIAKGLGNAHSKGIIHCDIKPSNIMITDDRDAKIVDFGIAKIANEEKLHSKERTSGTIAYMSPEQVGGSGIDPRTDIWSLGVIFYEILTKQTPFKDSYNEALMYSIINEEPDSISSLNPDVPPELEKIVLKMLNKNPDQRYQNVSDILGDLKNYIRGKELPVNPVKYFKHFIRNKKNKRLSIIFSFFFTFAILSIIYFTGIYNPRIPSIGILNMENLGNSEDEYWSRGITKDLIINVASAGVIRVSTFNEVNKFKQSDFSIAEIAEKLRVDYLLLSSIFKSDSTFDIWCRIIDPNSGKDLFAKKWNKPIENASTITTILSGTVLNNLGISSNQTINPIIIDPDAYELYLKGKLAWETRQNNDDVYLARGMLEKAYNKDKNFVLAKIQLGQTYTGTADYDRATKIFNECLDYSNQSNDKNIAVLAMLNIGNIYLYQYQINEAIEIYEKALKIARKRNDKYNEGKLLRNIGSSYYTLSNYDQAEKYYLQSQLLNAELDDKQGEGEALNNLGSFYIETQDYKEAMKSYKSSYDIFKKIDNKSQMGYSLIGISYSWWAIGEIDSALIYAERSLLSAQEILDKQNELNSLSFLGEIYYCIGDNEEAMNLFHQSSAFANEISDVYYSGISNQYLGLLMLRNNNYHEAMKYFEIADIEWKILKDPTHEVWTNSAWALAAQRAGEIRVATREILRTESILKKNKPYEDYAVCVYYNLYNYYAEIGDTSLVKKYLTNANNEMLKRLKYIDNQKNKKDFLNRLVEYGEIINLYKKYFD
ncbi:protein kinase [Candidatus Neomarinimicrobiota bacterium]